MKSTAESALKLLALAAIVAALPAVLAHGGGHDDGGAGMDMDMGGDADMNMDMGGAAAAAAAAASEALKPESDPSQLSYFAYTEHTTAIYAHIALMVVSWVVLLPIGKKESLLSSPLLSHCRGENLLLSSASYLAATS